jgi:RNA polymerase sigma-70 factor, ECF subfamily
LRSPGTQPVVPDELTVLLLATAEADRVAFRRLYDATSAQLLGMAMLMLRRRDAAEDAVQDGYVRIWSRARTFDPARGPALPWITRIVHNATIDRLRQERVIFDNLDDHAETLWARCAAPETGMDIDRAFATLTADQRRVILLVYLHGFTCQEVSRRLGVPVGTVKSWIRRGAGRLIRYFELPEPVAETGGAPQSRHIE